MKKYLDLIYSTNDYKEIRTQIEKMILSYFFLNDEKMLREIQRVSGKNYAFFEFSVQNELSEWIDEYAQYDWEQAEISRLFKLTIDEDLFESFVKLSQYFIFQEYELLNILLTKLETEEYNETISYLFELYNEFLLNYVIDIDTDELKFNGTILDLCRMHRKNFYISKLQQYTEDSDNHPLLVRPYKKFVFSQPGILLWSA